MPPLVQVFSCHEDRVMCGLWETDDWEMWANGECWTESGNYECGWLKLSNFF